MTINQQISEHFASLLSYPRAETVERAGQAVALLECSDDDAASSLARFVASAAEKDVSELEELYTATFDLRPSCCPYLGYQLCGEGYQRSRFLVGLQEAYRQHGFEPDSAEMADHFAEVLRFLSVLEDETAWRELVIDGLLPAVNKGIDGVEDDQPYAEVLSALQAWLKHAGAGDASPGSVEQEEKVS